MAGALTGHLVDSHSADSYFNSSITTQGAMSFNPNIHGTPIGHQNQSFSVFDPQGSFAYEGISQSTAIKIATLQAKLNQKLGPEYISQRPGPSGGPKLTYAEGWKIINLANEVFGFNGWSSTVVSLTTDFLDHNEESRRYNVGVTAVMRVTLRDGVFHEDVGYGMLENSKSKGQALDKCKKEAVTDGLKRALRNFGNLLGNCLYDKAYTQEVTKMKIPPPKFDKGDLHRRPEFEDIRPTIVASTSASTSENAFSSSKPCMGDVGIETPTRPPQHYQQCQPQQRPLSSVPSHIKNEMQMAATSLPAVNRVDAAKDPKGKAPQRPQHFSALQPPPPPVAHQNTKPLQHEVQQERRVTFAETNLAMKPTSPVTTAFTSNPEAQSADIDDDESFHFFSDDDAFLAAVDLQDLGPPIAADDADMGRPIEEDTDIGRPIDHGESLSDQGESVKREPGHSSRISNDGRNNKKDSNSRLQAIALAQKQQFTVTLSNPPALTLGSGTASGLSLRHAPQQERPDSSLPSDTTKNNQPTRASVPSFQNENRNPNIHTPSHSVQIVPDNSKRPSTPSVGGFHFPSGVNPLQNQTNGSFSTPNLSTIGIKRHAEAITGSFNRGSRPGMGLHQASASVSTGSRQVLGRLDPGDGGGFKRARR